MRKLKTFLVFLFKQEYKSANEIKDSIRKSLASDAERNIRSGWFFDGRRLG